MAYQSILGDRRMMDKILCIMGGIQIVCCIYFLEERQYFRAVVAAVTCVLSLWTAF